MDKVLKQIIKEAVYEALCEAHDLWRKGVQEDASKGKGTKLETETGDSKPDAGDGKVPPAEPAKAKRGRKPKPVEAEATSEGQVEDNSVEKKAEAPAKEAEGKAEGKATEEMTYEQLMDKVRGMVAKKQGGMEIAKALIKKFNAEKYRDLKVEQYPAVLEALAKELA